MARLCAPFAQRHASFLPPQPPDTLRGLAHPRCPPHPPALHTHDTPQIPASLRGQDRRFRTSTRSPERLLGTPTPRVPQSHLGDTHHPRDDTRRMPRPTARDRALFLHRLPTRPLTRTSAAAPPRMNRTLSTRSASPLHPGLPLGCNLVLYDFRQSGCVARGLRPLRYSRLADSLRIILAAAVAYGHAWKLARSRLRVSGSRTEQGAPNDRSIHSRRISHRPGAFELRLFC